MIPTINRLTRATINTATTIDHCITKTVLETEFKSGIIQTDLSTYFFIIFALKTNESMSEKHNKCIFL